MCNKSGVVEPLFAPWLLAKSTEGMSRGIYWATQKQGSAEAAFVGSRRNGVPLFLILTLSYFSKHCQIDEVFYSIVSNNH